MQPYAVTSCEQGFDGVWTVRGETFDGESALSFTTLSNLAPTATVFALDEEGGVRLGRGSAEIWSVYPVAIRATVI